MRLRNRSSHLSLFLSPIFHREASERVVQPGKEEGKDSCEEETKEKGSARDPNAGAPQRLGFPDIRQPAVGSLPLLQQQRRKEYIGTIFLETSTEEARQKEAEKGESARGEEGDDNRKWQSLEFHDKHYYSTGERRSWCKEKNSFPFEKRKDLRWALDKDNNDKDNEKYDSDHEEHIHKKKKARVVEKKWKCTRMNGRGWRCSKPTLVGYSLCEHHLGKGKRIKIVNALAPKVHKDDSTEASNGNNESKSKDIIVSTIVKARSMNSLILDNTSNA